MRRNVEVEHEFEFVPDGAYSCANDPVEIGLVITSPIRSVNNQKIIALLNKLDEIMGTCVAAQCPDNCALAKIKAQAEFYYLQNESDLRAIKD